MLLLNCNFFTIRRVSYNIHKFFRMECEIFDIQRQRIEQHKLFESAFEESQTNFPSYRTKLGQVLNMSHGRQSSRIFWK